jgi:hypothetical protein
VTRYFRTILSVPSRAVVDYYIDVLIEILIQFPAQEKQIWFANSLFSMPSDVLTQEEQHNILGKLMSNVNSATYNGKEGEKKYSDCVREELELIGKRARNSIMRGN